MAYLDLDWLSHSCGFNRLRRVDGRVVSRVR